MVLCRHLGSQWWSPARKHQEQPQPCAPGSSLGFGWSKIWAHGWVWLSGAHGWAGQGRGELKSGHGVTLLGRGEAGSWAMGRWGEAARAGEPRKCPGTTEKDASNNVQRACTNWLGHDCVYGPTSQTKQKFCQESWGLIWQIWKLCLAREEKEKLFGVVPQPLLPCHPLLPIPIRVHN